MHALSDNLVLGLVALGLLAASLLAVAIFNRWQRGVLLLFVLTFSDDLIRRLLPGQPAWVMLAKDFVLGITYLSVFIRYSLGRGLGSWAVLPGTAPFVLFAYVAVMSCFNPDSESFWFSAIGLRNYLWYAGVLFLGFYYFANSEQFRRFAHNYVLVALLLLPVALLQFTFYDVDHPLIRPFERTSPYHAAVAEYGNPGAPQVPSVFGSAERFSRAALLMTLLGIGALGLAGNGGSSRLWRGLLPLMAFLCVFLSGRRLAFMLATAGGVLLWAQVSDRVGKWFSRAARRATQLYLAGAAAVVLLVAFSFLAPKLGEHVVVGLREVPSRVQWFLGDVGRALAEGGLIGHGTGTAAPGLRYVPGGDEQVERALRGELPWVESGPGWLLWEVGVLGFLLYATVIAALLLHTRRCCQELKTQPVGPLARALYVYFVCMVLWFLKSKNIFADATTAIHSLFFLGALFGLRHRLAAPVRVPSLVRRWSAWRPQPLAPPAGAYAAGSADDRELPR